MDGQHPVRLQVAPVQLEGFASEQVDRDGVAGEGVDRQEIELAAGLLFEREAGIAGNDFVRAPAQWLRKVNSDCAISTTSGLIS